MISNNNFMKKALLLLTCLMAFAGTNAQNSLEFTTVSNENDMLYYASPQMDEPQKIVTDAGLIPEVQGMDLSYSIPKYIVECLVSNNDLNKGDANAVKDGASTRTSIPNLAKVVGMALPGTYKGGNSNVLEEITFFKNVGADVVNPPYIDERFIDMENILTNPTEGFVMYNNSLTCTLGATDDGILFTVPFTSPFIYNGESLLAAVYLSVKDGDRSNNVMFDFGKTTADAQNATIYHSYAEGANVTTQFNFYAGCNLPVSGAAVQAVLDYLDLDENSLPAFLLDFYTNDIRGNVTLDDVAVSDLTVNLMGDDRAIVATTTTDTEGNFVFESLDHTGNYTIEIDGYEIENNTVNFGDNAIDNDINVIVKLTTNTGIDSTIQAGQITDVKYINLAGVASSVPMSGMNLQVTTYSNGSRQVSKVIK